MESANSGLGEGEPYSIGTCDIVDLLIKKGSHCEMQGNLEMAANFYHTAFDKRPDIETAKILYGTLISLRNLYIREGRDSEDIGLLTNRINEIERFCGAPPTARCNDINQIKG